MTILKVTGDFLGNYWRAGIQLLYEFIFGPLWGGICRVARVLFTPIRLALLVGTICVISSYRLMVSFMNGLVWGGQSLGKIMTYLDTGTVSATGVSPFATQGIGFVNAIIPLQEMLNAACFIISLMVCMALVRFGMWVISAVGRLIALAA